ncbi:MAG: pentapeptide repeat-containing protein [Myxococcales bacterium]|nr:pentapeptide repeat-containing protein [Myxococcales bacterium]
MSDAPEPQKPPAPAFRRGPLLRAVLWITEPNLIKGIALGIVMSLVVTVGSKLEAVWAVVSGLLLIAVAAIFGVIIGHYVFESRKKKLQRGALGLVAEAGAALPALSEDLLGLIQTRDRHHLHAVWARLSRLKPTLRELVMLVMAMVFRVMAMSTLIAVLGGAISFAVFLATYLQVERMGEQNKLLSSQNDMIKKEMDLLADQMEADKEARQVELSLTIASHRQAIVLGLLEAIDGELGMLKEEAIRRGEAFEPVRRKDDNEDKRYFLTAGMYRRIQRTLTQLDPYRVIDPDTSKVSAIPRSPEQELLVTYLEGSSVELSPVSLRGAYLIDADLRELEIGEINFNDATFERAKLAGIDLSDAYLEAAILRDVQGARASFSGAHMARADLGRADLQGGDLSGVDLSRADLTLARLKRASLENADLSGACLAGADFEEADLSGRIKLSGADLSGADLSKVDKAPSAKAIKEAVNWEAAVYSDELAGKLGLAPERLAQSREARARLGKDTSVDEAKKILGASELCTKSAGPAAPVR